MNLFEAVKEAIPTKMAAEKYGIEVRRNGMSRCPFHPDKTPSLKFYEKRFHCFGCQADGDVIDFTSRLFGLNPRETAEKLAADFGIRYERQSLRSPSRQDRRPSVIAQLDAARQYQEAENRCYRVLCDYLHLLQVWKAQYAPQSAEEEWHPLFCEALKEMDYTEYLLDTLLSGSIEERAAIVKEKGKEVTRLEKRISELAARGTGGSDGGRERNESARHPKAESQHAFYERAV